MDLTSKILILIFMLITSAGLVCMKIFWGWDIVIVGLIPCWFLTVLALGMPTSK